MGSEPKILPANPHAGFSAAAAEITNALSRVLNSGRYILGPAVEAFEREWAEFIGAEHAIGVASGTDALELALRAAGVGEGDLVLTAANTVTATAAAIERTGATLVLGEIDPETFCLNIEALDAWLSQAEAPQVKAVVPVHLYGHPADMAGLVELAAKHGLVIVEDAAQAHGAMVGGSKVGTFGSAGAFSFYPTKNLGAIGDAGAVVTNDATLAQRVRSLRQYGWNERYVASEPGINSRLDELQAAILRAKLPRLDADTEARREIARAYAKGLGGIDGLVLPTEAHGRSSVWHQYVVRTTRRDELQKYLEVNDILSSILYPVPLHRQPAYRDRALLPPGGLGEAERVCREVLCLPIYPELGESNVARVVEAVRRFFA